MAVVIEACGVSKRFLLRQNRPGSVKERFLALLDPSRRETTEQFWALRDVSFEVARGEALGLLGRNGSGKSTLLRLIAGIHRPTTGALRVLAGARIGTMIELGVGFHHELTGRENVFLNAALHGLGRAQIEALYDRIVEYSELGLFMNEPLKNYSSGMHMRLGFAISANLDPDVLLIDEVFAVGDANFQRKCMQTMQEFRARGKTIVFVSHSEPAVRLVCDRACVLEHGRLAYSGTIDRALAEYQQLLAAPAATTDAVRAPAKEEELPWHRFVPGDRWVEAGQWQFDFLRRHGLETRHFVLDVGCGALAGGQHLLRYLEQDRYWGYEFERALLEAGMQFELARAKVRPDRGHFVLNDAFTLRDVPYRFDFAIANSLFARLPLNRIARCIASVVPRLQPDGQFYATWLDNPDPRNFDRIVRGDGWASYPDAVPYHYPYSVLANLCDVLGARAERLDDASHPRGEAVMVITPRT